MYLGILISLTLGAHASYSYLAFFEHIFHKYSSIVFAQLPRRINKIAYTLFDTAKENIYVVHYNNPVAFDRGK